MEKHDMNVAEPHQRVEYDVNYFGGAYSGIGNFAYVPYSAIEKHGGSIDAAFEAVTGFSKQNILDAFDVLAYTADGKLWKFSGVGDQVTADLPKEVETFVRWIKRRPAFNDVMREELRVDNFIYVDFMFGGAKYVYCAEKSVSAAGVSCESLSLQLKAFEFALRKGSWAWDSEKKQHRVALLNALEANHRLAADWYCREAQAFDVRVQCNALGETGRPPRSGQSVGM